jgi:hypothetical protein
MSKIDKKLKKQIQTHPEQDYKIIVTGSLDNVELEKIGLKPFAGLDNMYFGSIKGLDILKTEKVKSVLSIESDQDAEIFE